MYRVPEITTMISQDQSNSFWYPIYIDEAREPDFCRYCSENGVAYYFPQRKEIAFKPLIPNVVFVKLPHKDPPITKLIRSGWVRSIQNPNSAQDKAIRRFIAFLASYDVTERTIQHNKGSKIIRRRSKSVPTSDSDQTDLSENSLGTADTDNTDVTNIKIIHPPIGPADLDIVGKHLFQKYCLDPSYERVKIINHPADGLSVLLLGATSINAATAADTTSKVRVGTYVCLFPESSEHKQYIEVDQAFPVHNVC